jgi:1-acyl-sn-glycerol-3-phosphate acyltransferase
MSRAFPQDGMQPIYGVCHYLIGVLYGMFFRGDVVGLEHLPATGGFLVAANHTSSRRSSSSCCASPSTARRCTAR